MRPADGARPRGIGHVDDQDRHVDQLRQGDRALDRLALRHAGVRDRVVARRRRARADEPARQPGDHAVVLGVDHGEGAEPAGRRQDVEELLVPDAKPVVGHVDLERGDPLRDQPRQILLERLLGRVGDDQVKRVVDDRLVAGPAVIVIDDGAELHAPVLRGEGHHGRRAAERRGHGARVEIVRTHDAGRGELLEMDVTVDAAREDVESARVELAAPGRERAAQRRDPAPVDANVAPERLGRGDDGAAPHDEIVGHDAGIIARAGRS